MASSGKKQAPAVTVAVASVAVALCVMIVSVAIVLGFKNEIRAKVVGFNGHITVYPLVTETYPESVVSFDDKLQSELEQLPFLKTVELQAAVPAIFKTPDDFKGIYLKGLSAGADTAFLSSNLIEGTIPDFGNDSSRNMAVISSAMADALGLKVNDRIDTYFITDDLRVRRLEICGIYNSHFDQYDDVLAFGSLGLVQRIGGIGTNQGTYLQLQTDDFDRIPDYTGAVQSELDGAFADGRLDRPYKTDNVMSQGAGFFGWLSLLDMNVIVIIILMAAVGCITMVGGMLIIIIEKKRFIGIMKALGAPNRAIRRIFVYLALRIAIKGMAIGNAVALAFLFIQNHTRWLKLDPESYYIDFVPVCISWLSIVLLNLLVLLIIWLVLILPSRFAAAISPSETMRGE